ncbi:MAG: [protein-PII] uridylyltransferase [Acidimicrobiaceae bacterium]|nr:[protein-PII] uridylyltransferase [Acidimicrobiaceae bacterium]
MNPLTSRPAPAGSLPLTDFKGRRQALLDDRGLTGEPWCRAYAEVVDQWINALFEQATGGDQHSLALLAVGGHGFGEMAPGSDLDLLLVTGRRKPIGKVAEALWYPIWDQGVSLDHSVRTPKEILSMADADLKVALGLLTARVVAGDSDLGASVLGRIVEQWRERAPRRLPLVQANLQARHEEYGDLAFLLEPDLKEARGGLRDLRLLRSVGTVSPVLAEVAADPRLGKAAETLTAARVELQRATGRSTNRLQLQDQDAVAKALRMDDADTLMAAVAGAARTLAWASDDGWRRVETWLRDSPTSRRWRRSGTRPAAEAEPLEPGLVLIDEEVALAESADPATDPSLALRAAAASADSDLPLARATLDRLAAETPLVEGRWSPELSRSLLRLLGAGRPAIAAIEALDSRGIWTRFLPEWEPLRHRPQRNAYHRFTVDRHLLETVANATALVRDVERPDLLLMGALLHDIGKVGDFADHTRLGIDIVGEMAPRLGFDEEDTATLVSLVRHHLLLAEVATTRDLDDPRTIQTVAAAVGNHQTLELLAALTEADSKATGPAMWSSWKAGLIAQLVELVDHHLSGQTAPPRTPPLAEEERALLGTGRPELVAHGSRVSVAAPDRRRLLATVAGVLALSGATVRSAATHSDSGNQAFFRFEVAPAFDVLPEWGRVRDDLEAALDGRLPLEQRLDERERHYLRRRARTPHPILVKVSTDNDAATSATVVEVRAPDRGPLLHHVARAISDAGFDIVSTMISTLGAEAVDVFYVQAGRDPVTGEGGYKLADDDRETLEAALSEALTNLG